MKAEILNILSRLLSPCAAVFYALMYLNVQAKTAEQSLAVIFVIFYTAIAATVAPESTKSVKAWIPKRFRS